MRRVGGSGRGSSTRARQVLAQPAPQALAAGELGGLAALTKEQLRAECRRRGQRCSGNKAELLCRLGAHKAPRLEQSASPSAVAPAAVAAPTFNGTVKHSPHRREARRAGMMGEGESEVLPPGQQERRHGEGEWEVEAEATTLLCRLGAHKAPRLEQSASPSAVAPAAVAAPTFNGTVKHSPHRREARRAGMMGEGESEVLPPGQQERRHGEGEWEVEAEAATLVLWRRPLATLHHAGAELLLLARHALAKREVWGAWVGWACAALALLAALYVAPGPHQPRLHEWAGWWWWWCWWVVLGVLSSVGLGTGLHTFLLYLGPHIARVTLAAHACRSLDFPAPPYPHQIVCPASASELAHAAPPTVWAIMSKVRVESMLWGVGTALGELPPYFMARAARLSGRAQQQQQQQPQQQSRAGALVEACVARVGFLGILVCASVPNPLFDLAGLTCGHFLVPFPTFFGATLLGKAVVKMHLQKLFVIVAFDEQLVGAALAGVARLPRVGPRLHAALQALLARQRDQLGGAAGAESEGGWLSAALDKLVLAMVSYFLVSIVNSLAQAHARRRRPCPAPAPVPSTTPPPPPPPRPRD